jgi:hypothetical protein
MKFLGTLGELRRELAHDRTSLEELYLQLTSADEPVETNGAVKTTCPSQIGQTTDFADATDKNT